MNIHWFPGHMAKAVRMMEENLKLVDVIIYVLDARAPFSCLNPVFDEMFKHKKIIYVLNKADLAPVSLVEEWMTYLSEAESTALSTVGTATNSAAPILKAAKTMCGEKLERYRLKGVKTAIRALVAGVPNCGKSTIINNLCGSGKTVTGNKPGVTRGKQWVRVNEYFEVLDTPGTLYPKLTDQTVARHLAYIGSIKDEVNDIFELTCDFINEINALYPKALFERYKTLYRDSALETLKDAAKARGYLLKGGEPDVERMADAVLEDFRKGRLGKIILEKAGDYADR